MSRTSSNKGDFKAKIREENGKFYVVKESIFKVEEVELEGIKIKKILKMK